MLRVRLDTPGMSSVFLQSIKVGQMTARSIHEKIKELFEDLGNLLTLAAFPYLREEIFQLGKQDYTSQIPHKQTQPSPASKIV